MMGRDLDLWESPEIGRRALLPGTDRYSADVKYVTSVTQLDACSVSHIHRAVRNRPGFDRKYRLPRRAIQPAATCGTTPNCRRTPATPAGGRRSVTMAVRDSSPATRV